MREKKELSNVWAVIGAIFLIATIITCVIPEKPRTEYGADYSSYVLKQVKATISDYTRGTPYSAGDYEIYQVDSTTYRGSFYLSYGGTSQLQHFRIETDGYGNGTGIETY